VALLIDLAEFVILQYGTVCSELHTSAIRGDQVSAGSPVPSPKYDIVSSFFE